MAIGDHTPRTYKPGDMAYVRLALTDLAGIGQTVVELNQVGGEGGFFLSSPKTSYKETAKEVIVRGTIGNVPPGDYEATGANTFDRLGNRSVRTLSPPLQITVEEGLQDTEGPDLSGWGFTGPPASTPPQVSDATAVSVRDYGAKGLSWETTGSIDVAVNASTLTVANAIDFEVGDGILVAGAGASGADLFTTVSGISGTTFTLAAAAGTSVTNARIQHDDTPVIQAALDAADVVYFPPIVGGYGVNPNVSVKLDSNKTLQGSGYPGRLVRLGKYIAGTYLIKNRLEPDATAASYEKNITLKDLWIEGRRADAEAENPTAGDSFFNAIAVLLISRSATGRLTNITVEGCTFNEYPGPAYHLHNCNHFQTLGNKVFRPRRGGLIHVRANRYGVIADNEVHDAGDDGIAVNSHYHAGAANPALIVRDVAIAANFCSVASSAAAGSPVAVRGCSNIAVVGNATRGGKNGGVFIQDWYWQDLEANRLYPNEVRVTGNTIASAVDDGVKIESGKSSNVAVSDNLIYNAGAHGVRAWSRDVNQTGIFDTLTIANNDISGSGVTDTAGKGIYVYGAGSLNVYNLRVANNTVRASGQQGIAISASNLVLGKVSGNIVMNSNTSGTANVDQIWVPNGNKVLVSDNLVGRTGTFTARYGILLGTGTSTACRASDNVALDAEHSMAGINVGAGVDLVDNKAA